MGFRYRFTSNSYTLIPRAGTVNVPGVCGSTDSGIIAGGPHPCGLCTRVDAVATAGAASCQSRVPQSLP